MLKTPKKPFKPFFSKNKSGVTRIQRDTYGGNWYEITAEVRKRDRYTCQHPNCGLKENPKEGVWHHVHHIVALSRGGTTTKANLTLLCKKHHERKHKHM